MTRCFRALVEQAKQQVTQQHNAAMKQLRDYTDLGQEFDSLANEYAAVLEEIKSKEWALAQLRQAQEAGDAL
jgi:hypothetical protein